MGIKKPTLETGYSIRTLLLYRLYTMKYLSSNTQEDKETLIKEFETLQEGLSDVLDLVEEEGRIKRLNEAIALLNKHKEGVDEIIKIINNRNEVIDNLSLIGSNIEKLAEDVKFSVKKDQEGIGSELTTLNENILKMSIIIAIIVLLLILLSAIFISKQISSQLESFQVGLLGFFKYLNRESKSVERLDDSTKNEIGNYVKSSK